MRLHISNHCTERNEFFKEMAAIRNGGGDINAKADERNEKAAETRKLQDDLNPLSREGEERRI